MSNDIVPIDQQAAPLDAAAVMERVLVAGDLANLTPFERVDYYNALCSSLGLNPLTKPFEYITLNSKLTLYAKKDATEQLRRLHGVSLVIVAREVVEEVYTVLARATTRDGRTDESIGAVFIGTLKGEARANALMKAETKAKRRVTLSICGLGILDETEVETIPNAVAPQEPTITISYAAPKPELTPDERAAEETYHQNKRDVARQAEKGKPRMASPYQKRKIVEVYAQAFDVTEQDAALEFGLFPDVEYDTATAWIAAYEAMIRENQEQATHVGPN